MVEAIASMLMEGSMYVL